MMGAYQTLFEVNEKITQSLRNVSGESSVHIQYFNPILRTLLCCLYQANAHKTVLLLCIDTM